MSASTLSYLGTRSFLCYVNHSLPGWGRCARCRSRRSNSSSSGIDRLESKGSFLHPINFLRASLSRMGRSKVGTAHLHRCPLIGCKLEVEYQINWTLESNSLSSWSSTEYWAIHLSLVWCHNNKISAMPMSLFLNDPPKILEHTRLYTDPIRPPRLAKCLG